MSKIKIVCDSASDIPLKYEDLYEIEMMQIPVTLGDETYSSRRELSSSDFYQLLEDSDAHPTTQALSSFEFGELFSDLYDQEYTDIIYVSVCSKGSASFDNAVQAREHFYEYTPEAKGKFNIHLVDSQSYSAGYGYAVVEAAKMAEKGFCADAIVEFLQDWAQNSIVYFGLYSLKFAKRSPIIDLDSAIVGELIGFRPIMEVSDGEISAEATVRREGAIIPFLAELCVEEIEAKSPYIIIYGDDSARRDELADALTKSLGYPPSDSYTLSAAISSHTGSEAIGVTFRRRKQA